jgi:hypothetical protein
MSDESLEVMAVHRLLRQALLSNEMTVPVTHWFGRDGNDCDPINAVTCVCGMDGVGWFSVDLENFCSATVH